MNLHFNLFNHKGSKLVIYMTLTLSMFLFCFTAFGQTPLNIDGESLFRTHGYGVENHKFEVLVRQTIPFDTNYSVPNPLVTANCPYEIFSGSIGTYGMDTDNINSLIILPHSINDNNDYLDGVTTLDVIHIQRHILGIADLNTLTPTADSLYRKISADADDSRTITTDDTDMIRDLILGIRSDFTRTSWEWVSEKEITTYPASFKSNPYNFVINYSWPGGIIFPALSRNQIIANMSDYFTFRATKVGDIEGNGGSSTNSWICGTGYYFNEPEWSSRSDLSRSAQKITKGSKVIVRVNIQGTTPLMSVELPIKIDNRDFEIEYVNKKSKTALWHYNPDHERLMVVDFDREAKALAFENGKYLEIILKAKRDIERPYEAVHWCESRDIEVINTDLEPANVNVDLEMDIIEAGEVDMKWNSGAKTLELYQMAKDKNEVSVYSVSGQLMFTKDIPYTQEGYDLNLDFLTPGYIYIVSLVNESGIHTQKIFVN